MSGVSSEVLDYCKSKSITIFVIFLIGFILNYVSIYFSIFSMIFNLMGFGSKMSMPIIRYVLLPMMSTISLVVTICVGVLNLIAVILQLNLLKNGLYDLMMDDHESNYGNARKWFKFAPVVMSFSLAIMIMMNVVYDTVGYSSNIIISMIVLGVLISLLILLIPLILFAIFMIIGLVYYGIYVFQLGDDHGVTIFKPAGILMIFFPFIGFLLLYIGIKRLY
ncbi:MAG: hypothetical protein ACTSRW_07225 [Candidatus Helarchaeota archaeon]